MKALASEKLEDLHTRWDELETTTQAKARSLFDANRAELFAQSCSALESWLESLQAQLHSDDYGKDLTSVNILLKKQQVCRGPLMEINSSGGGGRLQLLGLEGRSPALQAAGLVAFPPAIPMGHPVRIPTSVYPSEQVRRQKPHSNSKQGNFSKRSIS